MTDYLKKSFSVGAKNSDAYRENWERVFGRKTEEQYEYKGVVGVRCPSTNNGDQCICVEGHIEDHHDEQRLWPRVIDEVIDEIQSHPRPKK